MRANDLSRWTSSLAVLLAVVAGGARAQSGARSGPVPHDAVADSAVLARVKAPPGFDVTVFARPPVAMYPTCLTAAPDGAVFVCVDPNLSLSTDKGRGRIVRLVDTNDDGRADRYSVFAEMDSPRGLVWDGRSLYVMHPPNLTAYRDTTGDGIADVSEDLVTGLGFDLDFRGADHATNGITLGIDGWIYIAVGDYGFMRAVGKDGTTISRRGGSVVRVRPDGTDLEIYAVGTRNIYDVAVDPLLNVFSRDNTNDGDGWDTRLHHLVPGANMGYPSLYRNFSDEHMPSLAELGAGAGTGALWVHDPGFPAGFDDMLYTGDWTLNKVFRHPMEPKGASFSVRQEEFLTIPHPSDMAMDGRSNMYVASLAGGQFTYSGDTVGFVVRVRPSGAPPMPRFVSDTLSRSRLFEMLVSANSEHRLHAQREILRRPFGDAFFVDAQREAFDTTNADYARVAAIMTYAQAGGPTARTNIRQLASLQWTPGNRFRTRNPLVRAAAFRAGTDERSELRGSPRPLELAIADYDPVLQREAVNSLVRYGDTRSADLIAVLAGVSDPVLSHVAVNALVTLHARDAALRALDGNSETGRIGALQALQQMHDSATVSGLIARVNRPYQPRVRQALIGALARLYHREAPWTGDWWGTQPAFDGPYFAPETWSESGRIAPVLRSALLAARDEEFGRIADELIRNRVAPAGSKALLVAANARGDARERTDIVGALVGRSRLEGPIVAQLPSIDTRSTELHAAVASLLAAERQLDPRVLPLVRRAALDTTLSGAVRGALVTSVSRMPGDSGLAIAADLVSRLNPFEGNAAEVEAAWRRFVGDRRRAGELDYFIRMARTGQPEQRTLAYSVLVQSVRSARTPAPVREKVAPVIAAAWTDSASAPSLVQAITIMRLETQYAEPLAAYRKAPWIQLFNGRDLTGWTPKFAGHELGVNLHDTFRVENGMLVVRYDRWPGFNGEFGHLFYERPFSHYVIAVEYRFVGDQVTGAGPRNSWAIRNNGIMAHSQAPQSMGKDQDFPISLEIQLLGGLGQGKRTTANLCTPGTHVVMEGRLIRTHCINSTSGTLDGDQWVRVEALVLGDSIVKHVVNGDTVLTYASPQMGGGNANNLVPGVMEEGKRLASGYIALQAETAPVEFRKVELLNLSGCMDRTSARYSSHYVHADPSACR